MVGDTAYENLGRALLAKAAVNRLAMARYPRYLNSANLISFPTSSNWQPRKVRNGIWGFLYNYNWTDTFGDARQIALLNETGVYLNETASFMLYTYDDPNNNFAINNYLILRDLTPEVGRFLADFAKQDLDIYIRKVQDLWPHWYAAFGEATLGTEHNLNYPVDSFQIFMAKSWIDGESGQSLQRFLDIPWLSEGGDLFYIHKLAETVKAYRGWSWSDVPLPSVSPTPTPARCMPLGNIDCVGKVNVFDLSALLSVFGRTWNVVDANDPVWKGDLNNSGRVNALDLSILLGNFGR
jgi:hypothetical protein